ncbi:Ltp family lipoprotein [uncultured Metabacillus sp.]|uniref:Ltp family lipoprotein n=1 Tax=uncultured Metabacillus sp. TaxID=2860135 RepID=UPI00262D5565|nr:Ltp family lipoprotein [uncultured Metabacillus sp.]
MSIFFGLIGFVGIIVFGIMAIVASVKKNGKAKKNFIITGVCFVLFVIGLSLPSPTPLEEVTAEPEQTEEVENEVSEEVEEPTQEEIDAEEQAKKEQEEQAKKEAEEQAKLEAEQKAKEETEAKKKAEEEKAKEPELSASQQNAIRQAENYISMMPFSKTGLIKQLEFEGYATDEATLAVENIEVDWREQAVKHAELFFASEKCRKLQRKIHRLAAHHLIQIISGGFTEESAFFSR